MKRLFRLTGKRGDAARDVNAEIQFHLDMRALELIAQGVSPEDAPHTAVSAFGNVGAIAAEVRTLRVGTERRLRWREALHGVRMDVTFAWRTLRKNRGFTAAAIATLALGIGATTAVFTVVNGVLLRPLPYASPNGIAMVWLTGKAADGLGGDLPLASGFYLDLKAQARVFSSVAAFRSWPYTVGGDGPAEQIAGARVTPTLFNVLGVKPFIGQAFTDADALPGGAAVALISWSYWQRRFGGQTSVIGQRVMLSGEPFTIVGVMPQGFAFPRGAELPGGLQFAPRTDIWTPLIFAGGDEHDYDRLNLAGVGRLRSGVTAGMAATDLTSGLHRWLSQSSRKEQLDYRVVSLQTQAGERVRESLLTLMGAVAFVLLIACVNVTNLLVARTTARQREFALRAALGAGRGRIARQLVTENILLALAGTAAGLIASVPAVHAMLSLVPTAMPRVDDVGVDWRVMVLAFGVAVVAGTIFGIAIAHQVRWPRLAATLQAASNRATGSVSRRLGQRVLVVAEISLSLTLLIGATELTLGFLHLQHVKPGFLPARAEVADVQMPLANGFNPIRDGAHWRDFFGQLIDRLNATPGIVAAGAVSSMPLTGADESGDVAIVGHPLPASGPGPHTEYNITSGQYFAAMGITLLDGRVFDRRDGTDGAPVIVVNREFVHRYLGDANPVGSQLTTTFEFVSPVTRTVVGVVDNVMQTALDAAPIPQVYVPEAQFAYPALTVVMRTAGEPSSAVAPLRAAVKSLDGSAAVAHVRTLEDLTASSLARQRFSATITVIFAIAALALAMIGLYGVIALYVSQRRREIGICMALGARAEDVLHVLLGEGMRITGIGIGCGLAGAALMARLVSTFLYGTTAGDAAVFALAGLSVGVISLVAVYLPARRATRVDPTVTLQAE